MAAAPGGPGVGVRAQSRNVSAKSGGPQYFKFHPDYWSAIPLAQRVGASLTLDGLTVSQPDWEISGSNCTVSGCTVNYGPSFSKVEVGADITFPDSPQMGSDVGAQFHAADFMQESSASWSIGTKDVALKAYFRTGAQAGTSTIFSNYTAGSNNGVELVDAAGTLRITIGDGAGSVNIDIAGAIAYTWYDLACYLRRVGSGVCYANSSAGTPSVISGRAASIATTNKLTLGASAGGANNADIVLEYAAAWTLQSWLTTHLQASDAMEFSQLAESVRPVLARGSPVATVKSRAGTALIKKCTAGVCSFFQVGPAYARVQRDNVTTGYATGLNRTNFVWWSEDISGASWVKLNAGDTFSLNSRADPLLDDTSKADGLIGQATNVEHGIHQVVNNGVALTAATHLQYAVYTPGLISYAKICNLTIANGCSFFDASSACTTSATVGAGVTSRGTAYLGGGNCLVWTKWVATAVPNDVSFSCAEADNDALHVGDATNPECTMWGMEVDLNGGDSPDTPIPTVGANGNKPLEQLKFASAGNVADLAGTMVCGYEFPTSTLGTSAVLFAIDDGTTQNRVQIGTPGTTSTQSAVVTTGNVIQANVAGATNNANSALATGAVEWSLNRIVNYVNGAVDGTIDTVATVPAVTAINIGSIAGLAQASGALINNCIIYGSPERPFLR